MLFGHHEFDDPTIQGNSFYINIVYYCLLSRLCGWVWLKDLIFYWWSQGRLDSALRRPWSVARPWRKIWFRMMGFPHCKWRRSWGFLWIFHGNIWRISAREMLMDMGCCSFKPLLATMFFFGTSCRDDSCKRENCYRPRTNHSFVGFIPISAKNRWFKVI